MLPDSSKPVSDKTRTVQFNFNIMFQNNINRDKMFSLHWLDCNTNYKAYEATKKDVELDIKKLVKIINMIQSKGYAAQTPTTDLAAWDFERREVGAHDVQLEILFCGVCHSDLHQIKDEWFPGIFPQTPW